MQPGEHGEAVGVVKGGTETAGGDAPFRGTFLTQEIAGEVPQDRQIRGTVTAADPTLVLTKGHSKDPMDAMLNPPVAPYGVPEGGRATCPTEQVVAHLDRHGRADAALALDEADSAQLRPGRALVAVGDERGGADRPRPPLLQPPVVLFDRGPMVVVGRGVVGEGGGAGRSEGLRDLGVQRRVVILERQRIVGPLGDALRGAGGLAAQRVDRDRRASEGEQAHRPQAGTRRGWR